MSIIDSYRQQFGWRDWPAILDVLPSVAGATILDLGCGVGDLSAEFVARGARVIGIDLDEELLDEARRRHLPDAEFRLADLRDPDEPDVEVDGVWASFVAAYFPDLASALPGWTKALRPGGWIALTEVDALFSHSPLERRTQELLEAYVADSLVSGRYDFHAGHKLRRHLEEAGFVVEREFTVEDQELAFDGAAEPEVVEAWRLRFARMPFLRRFCGPAMSLVEDDFLTCLARSDHRTRARVFCCVARKPSS
jgi:SAM-dependent methyltransferase